MNTQTMLMIIFCWVGGLAAAVYLIVSGHPWFALLILLMTASIRVKWD